MAVCYIAKAMKAKIKLISSEVQSLFCFQAFVLQLALCWCVAAKRAPRIAVLSMSTGVMSKPYMAQTVVNKAMYCNRHDYHFRLFHHIDESRPAPWSKILALKTTIKSQEHDWIIWLDSDLVITNFGTKVESMLPRQAVEFVVARDCNGLNTGAFILRASKAALEFLDEIYSGKHVDEAMLRDYWWEQRSFITLFERSEALRNKTLIVSQKVFNTYPAHYNCSSDGRGGWSHGDFAVHFPGTDDKYRENAVSGYIQKIVY